MRSRLVGLVVTALLTLASSPAAAISGDWGITRQAYSAEDCAYLVFLRNELDQTINYLRLQVQFYDAAGKSLGIYEVTAEVWIQPWTTDTVDWKIPDVCAAADRARIVKAIASY